MIVAPWLGEFGWEVALWVPWLRWMRRNIYRNHTFTVLCVPGHEALYVDFADRVLTIPPPSVRKTDCQNVWVAEHGKFRKQDYVAHLKVHGYTQRKDQVITPLDLQYHWPIKSCPRPTKRALPRAYCEESLLYDRIALHIRNSVQHPERNWRLGVDEVERQLVKAGYEVVCVGHPDGAAATADAIDKRGAPLGELCDLLAGCRMMIGPSSGPLHLAHFCLTPLVWWSANEKDLARYGTHWNPFAVAQHRVGLTWDPSIDDVMLGVHELLHQEAME